MLWYNQEIYSLGMGVLGLLSVKQRKGHPHGQIDCQRSNSEFSRWSLRRHFGMHMTSADPEYMGSCSWDLGRGSFKQGTLNSPIFSLLCLLWVSQFYQTFYLTVLILFSHVSILHVSKTLLQSFSHLSLLHVSEHCCKLH